MYNYEIGRVKTADLEKELEKLGKTDWELVSVVPTGETEKSPITGEYVLIIGRRPT